MTDPSFDSPSAKTVTSHPINRRLAVVCLALICTGTSAVQATTHYVTSLADSGPNSLRAALASAAEGDEIEFPEAGTIRLTGGELLVNASVIIRSTHRRVIVDGNAAGRVFHVSPGLDVRIRGLIITNGRSSAGGGGIYNDRSKLTIRDCTLSGNSAPERGGGIYNNGSNGSATLVINNSTLSDNNSTGQGGGIYNNGSNGSATLEINTSTLSGNSARGEQGSAIYNRGGRDLGVRGRSRPPGSATVRIVNSTVSGNSIRVAHGGAIFNKSETGKATLEIGSTILDAGARGKTIFNQTGAVVSVGYNLSTDDGGGFLTAHGDQPNTDPLLGPLTDNGGRTPTHWVPTNSPAIDAGFNFAETEIDQRGRGFDRNVDDPSGPNETGGDGTDIGSFEFQFIDPFPDGVAAGDVNQSSVVLWARARKRGTVWFEYGTDPTFASHLGLVSEEVETYDDEDEQTMTIPSKHLIGGLQEGTQYYYRALFGPNPSSAEALSSAVSGKFRTPFGEGPHGLRFGVSSCFHNDRAPFTAIRNVPARDLDFFVALGDTSYNDKHGQANIIKDRTRYRRQLGKDDHLVPARESTSFYATIDDHEVDNDFQGGGDISSIPETPNYVANEPTAPFFNRTELFQSSLKAFTEHWPIEYITYGDTFVNVTRHQQKLYRRRTFGDDAAIYILDTRSFRQTPAANVYAADMSMLSVPQRNELLGDLEADSDKTWKFVLTSVPMQSLNFPNRFDRWDGFAWERRVILRQIADRNVKNVVFISGDIHGTVSNEVIYQMGADDDVNGTGTWEITTGPVAHGALFANYTGVFPEGVGHRWNENRAFMDDFNDRQTRGDPDWPEAGLYNSPYATLVRGQYVSITTFGWTEFEILANKNLLVTTWGIYFYGLVDINQVGDIGDYTLDRTADPPRIMHQFEVTPE